MKRPVKKKQVFGHLRFLKNKGPFFLKIKKFLKNLFTRYNGTNINNVTVNYLLSPLYFFLVYQILTVYYQVPPFSKKIPLGGAFYLSLYSSLFYCWCSAFFQPDLDQEVHRPGKHSFPFGTFVLKFGLGRFLRAASFPLNRAWYFLWAPFGKLFTHRGAVHWPIVGVWLRVIYLYAWYIFIEGVLMRLNLYSPKIQVFEVWLKGFFPWSAQFGTVGFFVFCLPVFVADLFHSSVDLIESYKKGVSFCPKQMKRGILIQVFNDVKDIPLSVVTSFKDFVD